MKTTTRFPGVFGCVLALAGLLNITPTSAQITNTLFLDDFSINGIDTSKYAIDAPFFEGGVGTIAPRVENGVLEFTGEVTQQWWAGATLRLLQTFPASPETNVVISVDRVAENGQINVGGSSVRSAFWIMDFTRTRYVLFADNTGEGGWAYNRYIGESGDIRTGGGTGITAFDGVDPVTGINYDDLGPHRVAAVANGQDLKLYLDGKYGATVKFPFSPVVVELGSYARANTDAAGTVWDNLSVEGVGTATFSIKSLTMGTGQTASNLVVRIPPAANADKAVVMQVVNKRPVVATPVGASGSILSLTFDQGGPNTKTFELQALVIGSTQLTLTNTVGLLAGNALDVTVTKGPTVLLEEDFSGATLDTNKWRVNNQAMEGGTGTFEVTQPGGALQILGSADSQWWPGASIQTVSDFTASTNLPLVLEVDRVSVDRTSQSGLDSTGVRSGVFLTSYDADNNRTGPFVFFGQNLGLTGWEVNVDPGNPTGDGTAVPAFADLADDTNAHRVKLVADGSKVEVFLDGTSGGQYDFKLGSFIKVELGAYARTYDDAVKGVFDNVKIENVLPCITVSPTALLAIQGDTANTITVTIPKLLNVSGAVKVIVTSRDPSVAEPAGASNGSLTLDFPTGTTVKSFNVAAKAAGDTVFDLANDAGACAGGGVGVAVTPPPVALLSDDFSASTLDPGKWSMDTTPLVAGGTMIADSSFVTITNGMVEMAVTCESANWPGFTAWTATNYTATATAPILFEIDRVKMEYVLVGGNISKQRVGLWVKSGANYVFFSEFGSYDATSPGWQYHRSLGNPDTSGTYISPFSSAQYLDQQNHRMRIVVNGTTAKLYLDGTLGVEVPFPFSQGIVFGFGSYVNFGNSGQNIVRGFWDNAVVQGFPAQPTGAKLTATQQGTSIVITWTGTGTLQSIGSLGDPAGWLDVSPAPTGNSFTITPAAQEKQRFYRTR
jgi:hypothetical protein